MIAPDAKVHVLEPYAVKRSTFRAIASGRSVSAGVPDALRPRAIAADASATTEISLASVWRQLTRGTSYVVDGFFSEDRCFLVLSLKTGGAQAKQVDIRQIEILEGVLAGVRQKNISIDLVLSPSTVAANARVALASMGVDCKPSRAHPLLMLAVRAVTECVAVFARCSTLVGQDDRELRVISVPRPDRSLALELPSAELAVVRSLVEGLSYAEIARQRGTSTRTIANQVSAVFRRLHVSGRNELVQRLLFDGGLNQYAPQPHRETLRPPEMPTSKPLADPDNARRSA